MGRSTMRDGERSTCAPSARPPRRAGTPPPAAGSAAAPWGPALTRRQALTLGALSSLAVLAPPALLGGGCSKPPPEPSPTTFLLPRDAGLFRAWSEIILADLLPQDPQEREPVLEALVQEVERLAGNLPPEVQKELRQVLSLLGSAFTRSLLCGLWAPWEEAGTAWVRAAMQDLAQSRLALKRRMYQALHLLAGSAYFGSEASWKILGYKGPPQVLRPARPWEAP